MTDSERREDSLRAAAEELREYSRGSLEETSHRDVDRTAGLVRESELRDLLIFARQAYERHSTREDPDYHSTRWYQNRLDRAASRTATRAVENGNISQMTYIRGWVEYDSDVSGLHAVRQLEDWLCTSEQTKLIYLAALMGRGKTDLSLTMLQVVNHYYRRLRDSAPDEVEVPTPEFGANLRVETPDGDPDVRLIDNYDRLDDWTSGGSSDDVRWFIFDEASSELTAQSGSNAQDVAEVMAPFVKKMRKVGVNLIVIGHDRRDVHPAIRSLADFVDKQGLKTASFYSGIKNREPAGHLFDLSGIPPTSWEFDTDDMAEWSWGSALDDVEEQIDGTVVDEEDLKQFAALRGADLYESVDGITLNEAADMVSSASITVSNWMIRRARDGDYEEVQA